MGMSCGTASDLIKIAFLHLLINPVHFFLVMHRSSIAPKISDARRDLKGDETCPCPHWKFNWASHTRLIRSFVTGQLQEIKRKQTWCVYGSQTKLNNYLNPVFRAAFERIPALLLHGLGTQRTCLICTDIRQQLSVPTCCYSDLVSCLIG